MCAFGAGPSATVVSAQFAGSVARILSIRVRSYEYLADAQQQDMRYRVRCEQL